MSDAITAAINSSISSLPGADTSASSSSSSSSDAGSGSTDTGATGDTPAAPVSDTPITDGDAVATPPAADPAAVAAADKPIDPVSPPDDSLEAVTKELAGKRDNRIPHSRVSKIVENAVAKATKDTEAKYARYNTPEFQNEQVAMRVADEDPGTFLQAMAKADPRYAELLAGSKALGGAAAPAGKTPPAAAPVEIADVEPDIQLSDGTLGFSADASKKRETALRAEFKQREDALRDEFKQMLSESLAPVEPLVTRERREKLRGEAATRVAAGIERARREWPGFTEHQDAVAKVYTEATQRGETITLHDAYIKAVFPLMQADEAKVRAKIIAEMNRNADGSTRITPASQPKVELAGREDVDPITAAINASIAGLK